MNLRDLHYVIAVAESGSFIRAAERCHVSQPTLSAQIKKLEDYLGVRIFERTNKRVMLTSHGDEILRYARQIAQAENEIRHIAREARDPMAGDFSLGAMPTLASYIFPQLVKRVKAHLPKLRLLLVEEKTHTLVDMLKSGDLDAALLALPVEDDGLESKKLFDDPFYLAVDAKHKMAGSTKIRAHDLDKQSLLLLDDGHCLRDQALAVCAARGAREDDSFRATSLETLRLMVRSSAGKFATLMPQIAMQEGDGLRYIPFAQPAPSRSIGLVWRATSARLPLIEELAGLKLD